MYLGSKCYKDNSELCNDDLRDYISETNPSTGKEYDICIVSCSNPIPIKRVDMIIEALSLLCDKVNDKRIKWIHFGSSDLLNNLKRQAKNAFD